MTYQALARKWRPQDFSSIIGQGAVVTALRNAIDEGRIAHAYLFAGIRGVGKTTAARVFAKALNCDTRRAGGPDASADPCNECPSCTEITRGSDLDVLEIDAATYSKVEQVRELTESLRYSPAGDHYKVVVIDEIHRLSRQAFDALLKIVEEPPSHLVFVFATTEIEVVPATILSRCQEFHFRRVAGAEVTGHLRTMCEAESIEASDRALRLIARAGEGSVRDSVALLDQLATFGSGTITEEQATHLLGGLDLRLYHDLLRDILAGDAAAVSAHLCHIEGKGWDPRRTHAQFLGYCRDALHAAVGAGTDQLEMPEDDAEALATLATDTGYESLLHLLNQLLRSEDLVRRTDTPALAVEIAWLRAAELPKLTSIEEILQSGATGGAAGGRSGSGASAPAAAKRQPPKRQRAERPPRRPEAKAAPSKARSGGPPRRPPPEPDAGPPPESGPRRTPPPPPDSDAGPPPDSEPPPRRARPPAAPPQPVAEPPAEAPLAEAEEPAAGPRLSPDPATALLEIVSKRKQPLAARLRQCQKLAYRDGVLEITIAPDDPPLREALERNNNREILSAAVREVWGEDGRWALLEGEATAAAEEAQPEEDKGAEHPIVQSALDLFGGTIESIEDTSQGSNDP
jgi:DNA polymerase-3 subunit gamma/tau